MKHIRFTFLSIFFAFSLVNSAQESQIDEKELIALGLINEVQEETAPIFEDSLEQQAANETESDSKTFGFDYFNFLSETRTPILDIPLQSDYQLSFGDELELLLFGNVDELYNLKIDLSGNVNLPEIGPVSILNLTMSEANKKIETLIKSSFIGTNTSLSLKNASLKKISIIGAVKNPGTYIVNPFISLSEAIKYAGGLLDNASLREILITDKSSNEKKVDLYDFLIFGDRSQDVSLQNGDTIVIQATSNFFNLGGSIQRPMIYEYKYGDTVKDLIKFGLGLTREADNTKVALSIFNDNEITTLEVDSTHVLGRDLDSLFVPSIQFDKNLMALVLGSSVSQGYYNYETGMTAYDLVNQIDFSEETYPYAFFLEQEEFSKGKLLREFYKLSLNSKESLKSIKLKRNINIKFLSIEDINKFSNLKQQIESEEIIFEEIPEDFQDFFEFYNNQNLAKITIGEKILYSPIAGQVAVKEILGLFLNKEIDKENVSVISRDMVYTNGYDLTILEGEGIQYIYAPVMSNNLINVEVYGDVEYPGIYQVAANTVLNDLYKIAGNLKPTAERKGIVFSRQALKIKELNAFQQRKSIILDLYISQIGNINSNNQLNSELLNLFDNIGIDDFSGRISGNLEPDSMLASSTVLQEGDVIYVPSISNQVIISGEVMSPGSVPFKNGMKVKDYIKLVGGYTSFADKSKVFVVKVDGSSESNPNYLIQPGDTISIPKDFEKIAPLSLVGILSSVLSDLALAAASINVLNR